MSNEVVGKDDKTDKKETITNTKDAQCIKTRETPVLIHFRHISNLRVKLKPVRREIQSKYFKREKFWL